MNFMSREEISMIASVSDLWQTCDGWCSNRCVETGFSDLAVANWA